MTEEVVVTRKGQTTIPVKFRKKYQIEEGSRLEVMDTGQGLLLKPATTIRDLAGSGAKHADVRQMKKLLDRLREEDV